MDTPSLQQLARDIDSATMSGDRSALKIFLKRIEKALDNCGTLAAASLHFYAANCHSALRTLKKGHGSASWHDELLENEIHSLRDAINACKLSTSAVDATDLRFRVETNLANALNSVGRFVEALSHFDQVIGQNPSFGMAVGNRAHCVSWYARYLFDPGHQAIFLNDSRLGLRKALEIGVEEHATASMAEWLRHIESLSDWDDFSFEPEAESLGDTYEEQEYRAWCAKHRFFLNPLNDLMTEGVVANDVLSFPSVFVPIGEGSSSPPEVYGIFNQLKQEYVSARYVLFDAIQGAKVDGLHFSDERVKLVDMLDYRHYRLWVEKAKMAFLHAYAIFDKMGYLINENWHLGRKVRSVSFSNVWFADGQMKKGIVEKFEAKLNWPLRGLYWVSRDLCFSANPTRPMDPLARRLYHVRNHIAHKYLKVHDSMLAGGFLDGDLTGEELSLSISASELFEYTQKLLSLGRSSLIYLALGAHAENDRLDSEESGKITVSMPLLDIEDDCRI